jgi:hypothetical protein
MEKTRFSIPIYLFILNVFLCASVFAQEKSGSSGNPVNGQTKSGVACEKDSDCKSQDTALEGKCISPATAQARCEFVPKVKVRVKVINDRECRTCNVALFLNKLQLNLGDVDVDLFDYNKAKDLVDKTGLKMLPIYILSNNVKDHKNFSLIEKNLILIDEGYLVKPEFGGVSYFLDRTLKKGNLDLFISPFGKNTSVVINNLKNLKPNIHLLAVKLDSGFEAEYGVPEVEEDLRSVCIQKYYDNEFIDYLSCRAQNIESSWWNNCLKKVNAVKIEKCAKGEEGKSLLYDNIKLNEELKIMYGPAILLDNKEVFIATPELSEEDLKSLEKNVK